MDSQHINLEFNTAVAFVCQTNKHLFLTGKAGTGKTTFLKYIKSHCPKNMAILAPTGVAAINAGGVTIHSFFQLPFGLYVPNMISEWGLQDNQSVYNKNRLLSKLRFNKNKLELIRELDTIIIDEISMVRADLLDAVDDVLRAVRRKPDTPFGGVQMIFIGDLFQLPPVAKQDEMSYLQSMYNSNFFFDSRVIKEAPPICIELQTIYRQTDTDFIALLNNIRNNQCSENDIDKLNSFYNPYFQPSREEEYITLTSHNAIADKINISELEDLKGKSYKFEATITGEFPERSYPVDQTIALKTGAQIMFIKNDSGENRRYYNGKIGTIERIDSDRSVWVRFKNAQDLMELTVEKWSNIRYNLNAKNDKIEEEELGTFEQFPIRLAWAVTIHKSQGLTFDRAIVDAGRSFAPGQVYVALSRLTGLKGLVLKSSIYANSIATDPSVLAFVEGMQQNDEENRSTLLQQEREAYIGTSLLKAFNLEKFTEKTYQFSKSVEEKKIEQQSKVMQDARALLNISVDVAKTADRFCMQLAQLLPLAAADNYQQINSRTQAATEWFTTQLNSAIIKGWHNFLAFIKTIKRTTKIQQEISQIITDWERRHALITHIATLIQGVSDKKDLQILIEDYTQHLPSNSTMEIPVAAKEEKSKIDTRQQSLLLYKEGKSIEEIANIRSLQYSTIETHLIQFLQSGEVALSFFLSQEEADRIIAFLKHHDSNIGSSEIKNAFNDEFSYSQIRAVRTWYLTQPTILNTQQ